jgi:hypothetical protein
LVPEYPQKNSLAVLFVPLLSREIGDLLRREE